MLWTDSIDQKPWTSSYISESLNQNMLDMWPNSPVLLELCICLWRLKGHIKTTQELGTFFYLSVSSWLPTLPKPPLGLSLPYVQFPCLCEPRIQCCLLFIQWLFESLCPMRQDFKGKAQRLGRDRNSCNEWLGSWDIEQQRFHFKAIQTRRSEIYFLPAQGRGSWMK